MLNDQRVFPIKETNHDRKAEFWQRCIGEKPPQPVVHRRGGACPLQETVTFAAFRFHGSRRCQFWNYPAW